MVRLLPFRLWQSRCTNEGMTRERDAARLNQLLSEFSDQPDTLSALLREHLDAARFYLLGSMPHEYQFELKLAEDLLPSIEDETLQARVADFLHPRIAGSEEVLTQVSGRVA